MVAVSHATQAAGSNNGSRQVSVNAWNEAHELTGAANRLLGFDQGGSPIEVPFVTPEMFGETGTADDSTALQAAIDAAAALKVPVQLARSYSYATTLELVSGSHIRGSTSQLIVLTYTGNGAGIASATPGTRTHGWRLEGFKLTGSGAVGIQLDSVSCAACIDVAVTGFAVNWDIYSPTSGYSVYNRFIACLAQGGTGYRLGGTSSNANVFIACRTNLCTVRGVDITDSNDNHFTDCQFESGGSGVGVYVTATGPGLSPCNTFTGCRMEGFSGGIGYHVASADVADTRIIAPVFLGTVSTPISDSGTRTQVVLPNGSFAGSKQVSALAAATGTPWLFERTANGGSEVPACIIRDSATGSGTPVTLQIETERNAGYSIRVRRAGADQFTVTPAGVVDAASQYKINGTKVVGAQQAAIGNHASDATVNAILAALRAHGLIAT